MLRTTKWKLEKAKIKVVFRLQFHATNIPQSGWDKLFISFIPTESGKIIAKTSKANVRNGTCKWADPIYETTRLIVDPRNKRYDDNLYKLVVGMGTARASILGEATINLADYADASNPFVIALPLHGSDHGTILHVTVQLLTAKTGFREFEQQFDKGLQSSSNLNRLVEPSNATSSSSELQISDDHGNKVLTKPHFGSESEELISAVEETVVHEEFSDSPIGCNGSSNTSESYYADKIDSSSIHEHVNHGSMVKAHSQSPSTEKADRSDHQGWSSDYSVDNDLAIANEENQRLKRCLEMAESSIFELKLELSSLHSYANEMGTETQKIAQQLMAEISSGQKLEREIMVLRSDCLKFRDELEQVKAIKSKPKFVGRTQDQADRHQARWVNGLLVVEDQIRELQDKIHVGFHESNLSFIHSDLEVLLRVVQDLEKGAVIQETGSTRGFNLVEGKSLELLSQLGEAKAERENLIKKMDEMESYYEALVQELEENQKQIIGEFQRLRYEHSACAYTILTCKAETESMRQDMTDQILRFTKERHALGCVNEELEKRVMSAEALVQDLEVNQERILGQFQNLRNEHSTCASAILTAKAETESIRHDMNDQILKFAKERQALVCVNEELEKRVMTAEALVQELEESQERILGEFQTLRNEHSTCADTISTCKAEFEATCHDMNDQILKISKERHALGCVHEELKKRAMTAEARVLELEEHQEQILGEFESLRNEHSTCADTISVCKAEAESVRPDVNDEMLTFTEERHTLRCVNEELQKTVMTAEARVQELEENEKRILGEFQSLRNEHSTCADTISTCKTDTESIRHDMNDQILKFAKERQVFGCATKELEQRATSAEARVQDLEEHQEQILAEFESLRNEHSTCADTISTHKAEIESISHDMNGQILKFAKEKQAFGCVNKELEKRAMTAEARVQELEEDQGQILGEFESLRNEHSTCADTISTCKAETESIRHDMNDQTLKFAKERHAFGCVNEELEKRTTTAESALKRARLNYSIAVTQLQKDLDMLSAQVCSMFETNQNLVRETFSESLEPVSQRHPNIIENLQKSNDTLVLSDNELCEMCCANVYLDVYSRTLEETLFEASTNGNKKRDKNEHEGGSESLRIAFIKERCEATVEELKQELSVSKRHGDDILFKLQDALDEIESRKKFEASYLKKIEDLSVKIVGLEGELHSIQAELECALLNFECCKEEKEKIVALMQELEEENLKIAFELSVFREQLSRKEVEGVTNKGRRMGVAPMQIIESEGMKNEKSILSIMRSGSSFQDLQRELLQLHKADEELVGMYPDFKDFPGDGNALERVLALEIELAEALKAKKKSSIQFQSSFLKQHNDEEAIFKSFKDINELIKDTLDTKSKYVNMETELKEMHERYSQLSLQFAEVEGERQKLMMSMRSPRKVVHNMTHCE